MVFIGITLRMMDSSVSTPRRALGGRIPAVSGMGPEPATDGDLVDVQRPLVHPAADQALHHFELRDVRQLEVRLDAARLQPPEVLLDLAGPAGFHVAVGLIQVRA